MRYSRRMRAGTANRMAGRFLPLAFVALTAGCTIDREAPVASASRPAASAADLAGIDAAIRGVYAVISGPAGQERDWAAMRGQFTPGARLSAIGPRGLSGGTLDKYIAQSGPLLTRSGFTETELSRRVEVYGNLAHAWSSYRGVSQDGSIDIRGINSIQLVRQPDGRWLIDSILWQPETPSLPLPADMER